MFEKFNRHLHPQDGRFFIDEDGVRHKADNWSHLAIRLASYRKRAGKPPGNPEQEILEFTCRRLPQYCTTPAPIPQKFIPVKDAAMTNKILKWLAGILSLRRAGKAKKVSREEAHRRAEICARCPQQREMSSVCGACNATRKAATSVLLGNEKRVNIKLGGCRILHEDTSLSVHLEQPATGNPELPVECWRRG